MRNIPILPILALIVILFLGYLTTQWINESEDEERHQMLMEQKQEQQRQEALKKRRARQEQQRQEAQERELEQERRREELRLKQERLRLEAQAKKQAAEDERRRLELDRIRQELERKRAYDAKRQAEIAAREDRDEQRRQNRINVHRFDLVEALKDKAELEAELEVLEKESVDLKAKIEKPGRGESEEFDKIKTRLNQIPNEQRDVKRKLEDIEREIRSSRRSLIELGWTPESESESKSKVVRQRRRAPPSVILKDGTEIKYKIAMEEGDVYVIHAICGSRLRVSKSKIREWRRP